MAAMAEFGAARWELVALGEALTLAEGGGVHRPTPVALMARLLRVAVLHPDSVGPGILFQVADLVAEGEAAYEDKVAAIRMGWAAIVQAVRKTHGLSLVRPEPRRPRRSKRSA